MAKTVYIIAGPTAVGKTDVAMALAQRLGTAIISADSRQCYQGMRIGTAQPEEGVLQKVKHFFIDEFPVTAQLTAADFEKLALGYLETVLAMHDTAVVCGGTGLYIKALCEGLDEMPAVDETVSKEAEEGYKLHGLAWLQAAVTKEDPGFYETAEQQNPARLLRALSFVRSTGESINEYRTKTKKQRSFQIIKAGLELPRELLYSRINARADQMMAQGLFAEVERLLPYKQLKNLQTVGYAELFAYIDGNCTLAEAVDKIKQHTRNYAKRQLTWFKKDAAMHWLSAGDKDVVEQILAIKS